MEHGEIQLAVSSWQKSEARDQTSGVTLISDLRLLTSLINGSNGFNDFPLTVYRSPFTTL